MTKTNAGRGSQKQLGATGGSTAGPADVQVAQAPVSLGVPKWDAKVGAARYARERIQGRIVDKVLEAERSAQSKRRRRSRRKAAGSLAGSVRGSLNDSIDYSSSPPPREAQESPPRVVHQASRDLNSSLAASRGKYSTINHWPQQSSFGYQKHQSLVSALA
jgi:uncharacterized caspase-like protein